MLLKQAKSNQLFIILLMQPIVFKVAIPVGWFLSSLFQFTYFHVYLSNVLAFSIIRAATILNLQVAPLDLVFDILLGLGTPVLNPVDQFSVL